MKIYMSRDFIYIFKSKTSFLILSAVSLLFASHWYHNLEISGPSCYFYCNMRPRLFERPVFHQCSGYFIRIKSSFNK